MERAVLSRSVLKRLTIFLAGFVAALTFSLAARAAEYPNRPVTIVVAFTPGGPSDVLSRILGRRLQEILHQPFIVENRPGSGGNIAAEQVAHADPDGYTLLMGNNSILATNAAWNDFAGAGVVAKRRIGIGANYFDVCRISSKTSREAVLAAKGVRSVLRRRRDSFKMEYSSRTASGLKHFVMTVLPLDLEEACVGARILVPLAELPALHGGRDHGNELHKRARRDHHPTRVLGDMAWQPGDLRAQLG